MQAQPAPYFTVGVTTYKRPQLVVKAIQSVLAQSFTDYEVIVVDDASPDDTEQRVKAFALPNISYIRQPTNQGVSLARNEVIKRAQGEFIVFLDDDDRLDPEFLYHVHQVMRSMPPTVAFAITQQAFFQSSEDGEIYRGDERTDYTSTTIIPRHRYLQELPGSGTGLIVRTSAARATGGFSQEWLVGEDKYFMIQLSTKWDCVVIPQARLYQYDHEGQHLTKDMPKLAEFAERIGDLSVLRSAPRIRAIYYRSSARLYYALKRRQDGRRALIKALKLAPFSYKTLGYFLLLEINTLFPLSLRRRLFKSFRHGYLLDLAEQPQS